MTRKRETKTHEMIRRFRYNKSAVFGLILILFLVCLAIFAPLIAPQDPTPSPPKLENSLKPGFWSNESIPGYFLGTDILGRDILSRIIYGSRISLTVGFIAVGIATGLGILIGVAAGYYGGWIDSVLMRITDILFAFPSLLLAIAIGIEYSPQMARVMRGAVLYIKEMEYIEAQKAIGSKNRRIIFRHVLPNSLSPVIVYGTLMMAGAILDAAALGFLGLGAQPPSPEWGAMLSESRFYIVSGAWWAATFPGVAIVIAVLGLNLLGDGLRDILDPRLKE
jgi:ABC-type dipeptide/oligopeptide/nickel transport system permease subunit